MINRKHLLIVLVIGIFLSGCSSTSSSSSIEPTSLASAYLSVDYADATNIRSQLAYGTIKLANTANSITFEQAQSLIPLWQGIIALSGDTTTASEELTAIQDQITTTLTTDQLKSIAEMKITNAQLNSFYAEYGVVLPTPIPGVTKVPGSGSTKTEEEKAAYRATAEAAGQTTGSGQSAKTLLFEKTIEYLMNIK
ncbi:MAG: hypothetical protein ACD_34C00253G0005 [uncultured bacterium]|nr:MAG: hypothetical protein ACD_34C00253G0005 [uncultured bacterium]HCS38439.1 hypothetical protein [Anaerolineaceae bacterium]